MVCWSVVEPDAKEEKEAMLRIQWTRENLMFISEQKSVH